MYFAFGLYFIYIIIAQKYCRFINFITKFYILFIDAKSVTKVKKGSQEPFFTKINFYNKLTYIIPKMLFKVFSPQLELQDSH